jgi:multidrug efflux system membrane fusion protein
VSKTGQKRVQGARTTIALAVGAVIAITGMLASLAASAQMPAAQAPAVPVTVGTAMRQDVPLWLRGIGTVQALNTVLVRARVDGTMMKFVPTEGQEVRQGDLIAVIDPRPYQAVLDQATAKQAQDEADLANARHDLERYASLARQDYASHQQVDTQKALVDHMSAAIAGDVATVESAKLNLSFCYITSPVAGRVGLRQVDPGNLVHATDPGGIVSITEVHPITVVFTLPQSVLPPIVTAMGQRTLTVAAWSRDDKSALAQGALLTPDNAIDVSTGTIRLKATFPNQDNKLWPGQFVEARLLLNTEQQVVTVPTRAVQHGPNGLYVYIVKPDSSVQRQAVEATEHDDVMTIAKGLEAGQQIVVEGQSRLENGIHIVPTSPTASAPQTKS